MTLTDCQIFMTVSQLGTFAAAAEQMHLTPSAISHAVSGMESECGFLLFTRTKSGVTMTAAAESLLPSIRQMLNSSELLSQSIAQVNGMHKGVLRLGVFNSACVTWVPQLVPPFQKQFPIACGEAVCSFCTGVCYDFKMIFSGGFRFAPPSALPRNSGTFFASFFGHKKGRPNGCNPLY